MFSPFEYDASRPDCDTEPYVWRRPDDNGITLVIIDDKMEKFGVCEQLALGWLARLPEGRPLNEMQKSVLQTHFKDVNAIAELITYLSLEFPVVTKVVLSDFPRDEEVPWLSTFLASSVTGTFFVDLFDERKVSPIKEAGDSVISLLLENGVPKDDIAIFSNGTSLKSFTKGMTEIQKFWPAAKDEIVEFFARHQKRTWQKVLWPVGSENWFGEWGVVPHDCPKAESTGYKKIDKYIKTLTGESLPPKHRYDVYDAAKTLVGEYSLCDTRCGDDGHNLTCGALALLLAFGQFQETGTAADWIARLNWIDTEPIVIHLSDDRSHGRTNREIVAHLMEELWPVLLTKKREAGESTVEDVVLTKSSLEIMLGFDGRKLCDNFKARGGGNTTRALRKLHDLIVGNGKNGGVETGGVDVRVVDRAQTKVTIYAPGRRP